MIEKTKKFLQETFNPTPEQQYTEYVDTFRELYIPKRYNQIRLLDELMNNEIDHYISISNRTDGKSFNYIHALLNIAIEYNIGLSFFSRNMMLRNSYQTLINEIIDFSPIFDRKDFNFLRNQYYVTLTYMGKDIAVISDLNNAGELKYYSNYIKHFPIMVYDEFLALETDYLGDEWERLQTIYESIDRKEEYPLIGKPKIFYFGNAVNFDSPVLHGLKIFNILERHPINTAKIYKYDYNIMLEINRNDNANEQRNTRAFSSKNDSMTTAQFQTNSHNIAEEADKLIVNRNPRTIYVKLRDRYLKIKYNPDVLMNEDFSGIILAIESRIDLPYQFNMELKDNKSDSKYLDRDKYFNDRHIKKIDQGAYLFENTFSKNNITSETYELNTLRINKLVRETMRNETEETETENKEKQFQENYIEQTKKGLMRKIWG